MQAIMKSLNEQFAESLYLTTHAWRTALDRRLRPAGIFAFPLAVAAASVTQRWLHP